MQLVVNQKSPHVVRSLASVRPTPANLHPQSCAAALRASFRWDEPTGGSPAISRALLSRRALGGDWKMRGRSLVSIAFCSGRLQSSCSCTHQPQEMHLAQRPTCDDSSAVWRYGAGMKRTVHTKRGDGLPALDIPYPEGVVP